MSLVRSLDIHAISSSLPAQSALPSHAFSIEMNLSEPEQKKNLVFTILMAGRCTDKQQTERIFVICIAVLDLAVKVIKKKRLSYSEKHYNRRKRTDNRESRMAIDSY